MCVSIVICKESHVTHDGVFVLVLAKSSILKLLLLLLKLFMLQCYYLSTILKNNCYKSRCINIFDYIEYPFIHIFCLIECSVDFFGSTTLPNSR